MWTPLPLVHMLRSKLGRAAPPLESVADTTWDVAPGESRVVPRAHFLPGQLERITGWAFTDEHPGREMEGGITVMHAPTRAALVRNVWLVDGVLYARGACSHLRARSSRVPRLRVPQQIDRAAMYCTFGGNRYFGTWLMDDCPTYALACAEGMPVTTDQPVGEHQRTYERWLDMAPKRLGDAFFRELVIFSDHGQNASKAQRCRAMRSKLLAHVEPEPHPGVFLVRGTAGERRILRDELALAEHLRDRRGFRIVDPMALDVPGIAAACAGARMVVGIEGSALMHGVVLLEPGAGILVLQPPERFTTLYKHWADREQQQYGFVVGTREGADFRIDTDDLDRTLDLFDVG